MRWHPGRRNGGLAGFKILMFLLDKHKKAGASWLFDIHNKLMADTDDTEQIEAFFFLFFLCIVIPK